MDEAQNFPRASKLLKEDFYVDDFISGASSLAELTEIRNEVTALLDRGGFPIRKWASNHPQLLYQIDRNNIQLDHLVEDNPIHKTLGITWDSKEDSLKYMTTTLSLHNSTTKRKLLSDVAKIYDPLGLLGPVKLYGKALIHDCWKAKVTWDESLPQEIQTKWRTLVHQLPHLRTISFPRQLINYSTCISGRMHGFCDASKNGYGACLFVRSTDSERTTWVRLACSKSRVAPLNAITIPRLELCAASVLNELYLQSKDQFKCSIDRAIMWSDSTIVLCWLKKSPHLLRPFKRNRVTKIQSLGDQVTWRHVRSEDNPADPLSRGLLPSDLLTNSLWYTGPSWLSLDESKWPRSRPQIPEQLPGVKQNLCLLSVSDTPFKEAYTRCSSYDRLIGVMAYAKRWLKKSRMAASSAWLFPRTMDEKVRIKLTNEKVRYLLVSELREAEILLLQAIQKETFPVEHACLSNSSKDLKGKTYFDKCSPFIGRGNLIRIGGRLVRSNLTYGQKHPIVLPQNYHVTQLIIRYYHKINLHTGVQSTHYSMRQKFFLFNAKSQIRNLIHRCIKCLRQKPPMGHAPMATLPEARVTESYAFYHTGVDFFGPFNIKEKAYRNKSFIKVYGCLFICLASKAVHIELAIDLSSEGFLTAFRRFIHRKGVPAHVYSDNGTNFVGANRELQEICNLLDSKMVQQDVNDFATSKRIQWHFNPPLSPHFGGLWEAAVKSFKHHLKRILDRQLTFEQFETMLIEVEAILNSRPLYAVSSDPLVITPGHLLIGRPLNFLPEESLLLVPDNRLSTYQFLTKARQNFWKRWSSEYLHELQLRSKWEKATAELKPGAVVLLQEDNATCGKWPLGMILEVHPGSDGVARVADVKTASGVYKRNITRLCVLPIE